MAVMIDEISHLEVSIIMRGAWHDVLDNFEGYSPVHCLMLALVLSSY